MGGSAGIAGSEVGLGLEGSLAAFTREKSASEREAAAVGEEWAAVSGSGVGVGVGLGLGLGRVRAARVGCGGDLARASCSATCSWARRATSAFDVGGV